MNYWRWFKIKILKFLGIEPKLNELVLENLREKETEQKGYVPEPTPITRKCNYSSCKKKLVGLTYKCPYCHGVFCEKHRLPESHCCENPRLPREMKLGIGNKKLSTNRIAEAIAEKN